MPYCGSTERECSQSRVTFQKRHPHFLFNKPAQKKHLINVGQPRDPRLPLCTEMLGPPDEDDLSKSGKLIQQLIDEFITKVVIGPRGAERHQDGAIWWPLSGDDIFVDLVPCLWVHLQDVHIYYCHHRPKERGERNILFF